jgi:hypothetical protein
MRANNVLRNSYNTRPLSTTNTRKNNTCSSNTCDMYTCRLRHINDPVLSSLKMEDIRVRLLFANLFVQQIFLVMAVSYINLLGFDNKLFTS